MFIHPNPLSLTLASVHPSSIIASIFPSIITLASEINPSIHPSVSIQPSITSSNHTTMHTPFYLYIHPYAQPSIQTCMQTSICSRAYIHIHRHEDKHILMPIHIYTICTHFFPQRTAAFRSKPSLLSPNYPQIAEQTRSFFLQGLRLGTGGFMLCHKYRWIQEQGQNAFPQELGDSQASPRSFPQNAASRVLECLREARI